MTSAKLGQSVMTVALLSAGVIAAGLVMNQLRTSIPSRGGSTIVD